MYIAIRLSKVDACGFTYFGRTSERITFIISSERSLCVLNNTPITSEICDCVSSNVSISSFIKSSMFSSSLSSSGLFFDGFFAFLFNNSILAFSTFVKLSIIIWKSSLTSFLVKIVPELFNKSWK